MDSSPLANASIEQVTFTEGRIHLTSDPNASVTFAQAMQEGGVERIEAEEKASPGMLTSMRYSGYSHSAVFAEVRVDEELGIIRVTRIVNAVAAGTILNPKTARSQILGGVVFGIGSVATTSGDTICSVFALINSDYILWLDTQRAKANETARRLMTIPGVGPVTAVALAALAPPAETFKRGRDFAAWVGLTPLQHSTGGKQKLGATSKMGERTLRRLLIIGASAVVRWVARNGAPAGSWMARMIARKPPMLVRVALANKMARIIWALMARGGVYQAQVAVA
jgi:Transposase IS116/IS110/IS902 family/Molybdopterin-binding domain of aldehyde dehydrogenase